MVDKITFREDTQDILKGYAFEMGMGRTKIFCPNCFYFRLENSMKKHFSTCTFILKGDEKLVGKDLKLVRGCNDLFLNKFIKRFQEFIYLDGGNISKIRYNQLHDYWILQRKSKNGGWIPIGLASVKFSSYLGCHVIFAMIVFPKKERSKGVGKLFTKNLIRYYKLKNGLIAESPNKITKKFCEEMGIDIYYAP